MRHGKLSREEATAQAGADTVKRLDSENCDFTNRAQTDGDTDIEFSASIEFTDKDGCNCRLVAYYYQSQEDYDSIPDGCGLDWLDWDIHGYEII